MAKYERRLSGNFDSLLQTLDQEILGRNISADRQDGSDFAVANVRCAVRVYERYSVIGRGRVAANITLLGVGEDLSLSIIAVGGSQAIFLKINTLGEQSFLDDIIPIIESWEKQQVAGPQSEPS